MDRLNDLKKLSAAAAEKLAEVDLGAAASDVVFHASELVDGAEAVADRSGLTKKNGKISKFKVAKAALRPGQTARTVLGSAAEEVRARRTAEDGGN